MVLRLDERWGAVGQATPRGISNPLCANTHGAGWAEDYLSAGTSALLLLLADLFPKYWLAALFALIPLLYRITRAAPGRALRLGFLFGVSFFGVSLLDLCLTSPDVGLLKVAAGTFLFALFGWLVALGCTRWGYNSLIVALLWIGLELAVIKLGFRTGLLPGTTASHPLFHGMAALFGFLSISFIIIVLNSLLILAFETVVHLATARGIRVSQGERKCDLLLVPGPVAFQLCLVPDVRGPPCFFS